jgi:hypothetical protein
MFSEQVNSNQFSQAIRTATILSQKIEVSKTDEIDDDEDNSDDNSGLIDTLKSCLDAKFENWGFGEPESEFMEIASKMTTFVDKDGSNKPVEGRKLKKIAFALQDLGEGASKRLEDGGLSIYYVNPDRTPESGIPEFCMEDIRKFQGSHKSFYYSKDHVIMFSDRPLTLNKGNYIHELTHALDDIMVPDNSLDKTDCISDDPELEKLYENYKKRTSSPLVNIQLDEMKPYSGKTWEHKAKEHKREYLAYATQYYLSDPLSKRKLAKNDPEMFQYVTEFLEKANQDS